MRMRMKRPCERWLIKKSIIRSCFSGKRASTSSSSFFSSFIHLVLLPSQLSLSLSLPLPLGLSHSVSLIRSLILPSFNYRHLNIIPPSWFCSSVWNRSDKKWGKIILSRRWSTEVEKHDIEKEYIFKQCSSISSGEICQIKFSLAFGKKIK